MPPPDVTKMKREAAERAKERDRVKDADPALFERAMRMHAQGLITTQEARRLLGFEEGGDLR